MLTAAIVVAAGAAPAFALTPSADLIRCQKQIEKIRAFAKVTAVKVHACAEKVVRCKLADEIDSVDPTACLAGAATFCANVPTVVGNNRAARRATALNKCGAIPLADLEQAIAGLGFVNVSSACASLPPPLTPIVVSDVPDLVDCLLDTTQCAAEREVFLRDPRAQDSLTAGGIAASFPCAAP
jgi:hypothetical protein